jgi:acyl carrier protein
MSNTMELKKQIFNAITSLLEEKTLTVLDDTPLIGDGNLLDSMKLVELCLTLEDMAADLDFEFDWTSDATMSKSRSMFRTAGALATEFIAQMESKK